MIREWRVLIFVKNDNPELPENLVKQAKEIVVNGGSALEVLEITKRFYPEAESLRVVEFDKVSGYGAVLASMGLVIELGAQTIDVMKQIGVETLEIAIQVTRESWQTARKNAAGQLEHTKEGYFSRLLNILPKRSS